MRRGTFATFVGAIVLSACDATSPDTVREFWVADLVATKQVLFMDFTVSEGIVTGTGTLSYLVEAPEALVVRGRRTSDSLYVTFARASIPAFSFAGRYALQGPLGVLHGAEFDSVTVGFKRP